MDVRYGTAALGMIEHGHQHVVGFVEQIEQLAVGGHLTVFDVLEQGFGVVTQMAHGHRAGHACAAFERMQRALQILHQCQVIRTAAPVGQRLFDATENIHRLFLENFQQIGIDLLGRCRRWRRHWHRRNGGNSRRRNRRRSRHHGFDPRYGCGREGGRFRGRLFSQWLILRWRFRWRLNPDLGDGLHCRRNGFNGGIRLHQMGAFRAEVA